MSEIENIISKLREFNEEREWSQFHDTKNLALALSIEASELNEVFLWKKAEDADIESVKEELADVFLYAFILADKYNLDVSKICMDKIKRNAEKYPIDKSKGTAKKYTEL